VAVIISILIAFDVESGKNKGIIRALIFFTLGMPFILLAGWYLAGGETSPVTDEQLIQATLLLGLGFVFWLGVFPFHSWIPLIAEESDIPDGIYILTLLPFTIVIILLKYLNGFVWLRDYSLVYQALMLLGAVMVLSGSIWSVFQTRIKKMIGYLTIFFSGYILIAVGLNSSQGYLIFSEMLLPRFLSLYLMMVSLLIISDQHRLGDISDLRSLFYEYPFSSSGLLISLFTMIGMPLTVGFLPMQSLYQATSRSHFPILITMIASVALLTIALSRLFMVIMHPVDDEYDVLTRKESLVEKILISAMIGLNLISGLLPKILFPGFAQILKSFELLVK
jgi:NADH-quinone oxidoreductase subunit N